MVTNFLDKLIDWKEFELFVSELYKDSAEVIVQHNVTEIGKSKASRQTDVKVIHKTKLHTYITLIECKKWKHNVTRERIDIMAESIRELNASKGVIFTTKGYQKGALEHAKHHNIDLFIIRDLTDSEWGQPGRNILLYLQYINGQIQNIKRFPVEFKSKTGTIPSDFKLNLQIEKDVLDPNQYLVSIKDGRKGIHLVNLLLNVRNKLLYTISEQVSLLHIEDRSDKVQIAFKTNFHIDFSSWEFCQLNYPFGLIKLSELDFEILTTIDQDKFEMDRAQEFDFALVVENYITKSKSIVTKQKTFSSINILDQLTDRIDESKDSAIKNDSLLKIYLEPFISIDLKPNTKIIDTDELKVKPK
jgi:hypothetical protein